MAEKRAAIEGLGFEMLGKADLRLSVELIACGPESMCLPGDGLDKRGVGMAEDSAAETGEEVDEFLAVGIPQAATFAANECDGEFAVIKCERSLMAGDDFLTVHCAFGLR